MALHLNNGACPHCLVIIAKYPGFHESFKSWFVSFQASHPEGHISCAGRGKADQEVCVVEGTSDAHFPQSAHNWNVALDFFHNIPGRPADYSHDWFANVLAPKLPSWLKWYGKPGSEFHELPHVEIRNWKALRASGALKCVEPENMPTSIA